MGPIQSQFVHHMTDLPSGTTYIYTRSNRFGAVESRRTTFSPQFGAESTITFSDGHGYLTSVKSRGSSANNLEDYYSGGPKDGFNEGDYSHLLHANTCKCCCSEQENGANIDQTSPDDIFEH